MWLRTDWTDPRTGAVYPGAALMTDDLRWSDRLEH